MKIAVIGVKGLPPKQGGIEHYCAEVYPRMVAEGHEVDLFARCSYTNESLFTNSDYQGVRVISLPSLPMRGIDAFVTSALAATLSSGKRYDIIHFHALGPSLFSSITKMASSAKIVATCQGLDWQRDKWGRFSSRVIYEGEKAAVKYADGIVVVSEALQSYFLSTYGKKTIYIPNAPGSYGESDPDFNYGKKLGLTPGKYMVFLGRLVPEKRPDLLINAFIKLKLSGWKLVLVGGVSDTKSYTSELLNQVAKHPEITFAGELWGAKKAEIIRNAGLFVLPSDLEGLPLAMLEAMQEGIPVVASDIDPHQQLLDENRGVMFAAGNLTSCADALNWAIRHPEELKVMANKAQKHIELYYNWQTITLKNLQLYKNLLNTSQSNTQAPYSREISAPKSKT
ncbi:glycosyltransferase family 4 protein [Calothrix sp. PCC 6303]|uniref:glycosyltransferase family 4 protein n=1 Tax=Calothrix sp. PCC 6303 TaxID=1170562 RepID=UPI0002A03C93|nr:glycosyltransferase family 4 protein [Calothrix sp. PCC 6303]AFY99673.1 glycosyl transferase group 1 [Calothrix sp. PCC 6303]